MRKNTNVLTMDKVSKNKYEQKLLKKVLFKVCESTNRD